MRRGRRKTITPAGLLLVVVGFLALTMIVISPAMANARSLDGAGTASLENSPVTPVAPSAGDAGSTQGEAGVSTASGGGIGIPGFPVINRINCLRQCVSTTRPTRGAIIGIQGKNLERATSVVFRSKGGRIRAKIRTRSRGAVRVTVPKRATRGYVFVIDSTGNRSNRSPRELRIFPISAIPIEVFPVRGPFSFGSSGSRFGAGRPGHIHQGQDVSATCGTRLVAIRKSKVVYNQWDDGGGNYVVLRNFGSNTNFVYMHMIRRSPLRVGQVIGAGTPVGRVGNTGRSYGCHLHFEYWVGPWQTGGRPIDPLGYLRSLLDK
ncbi:MAG: family metallopeptidase [Actinomycetota bacterium]|jgi:murein DD-endopeptidase MepM/ murein hydrolase activator NlpD|nr:family metallopeptidase [Actinomycetota bacterium]